MRLSGAERRQIKTAAATRGMTLRDALLAAFATWDGRTATSPTPSKRPADPSKQDLIDEAKRLAAELAPPIWLQRAARLEWAKCPQAELGPDKMWLVRGTDVPLLDVLEAVSYGYPADVIVKEYEVPMEQLTRVMQFVEQSG